MYLIFFSLQKKKNFFFRARGFDSRNSVRDRSLALLALLDPIHLRHFQRMAAAWSKRGDIKKNIVTAITGHVRSQPQNIVSARIDAQHTPNNNQNKRKKKKLTTNGQINEKN
jgi:hypothetical protein